MKNGQNIYNDSQNVHNHQIQESIRNSVNNILQIKPVITNFTDLILNDPILTQQTKEILIEYSNDTNVYMALNITFNELLIAVFNRIEMNEHKDEIKRVLNVEMNDSICKCFTGRISRLVNCLNGFDDLVDIKISENEQIAQIIDVERKQLENNSNYDVIKHKQKVKERLIELKYEDSVINEWIDHIE
jgi:hypothetical protein